MFVRVKKVGPYQYLQNFTGFPMTTALCGSSRNVSIDRNVRVYDLRGESATPRGHQ